MRFKTGKGVTTVDFRVFKKRNFTMRFLKNFAKFTKMFGKFLPKLGKGKSKKNGGDRSI